MTFPARRIARLVGLWAALLLCAPLAGRAADHRWGEGYIPNLPVVDQDGRSLRFYDDVIKGRIVVISFIFTRCRAICPLMTARLAEVADRLGEKVGRDIFLVSISVDPEHDRPEALKSYAEAFHQGPGWLFLTGELADIRAINAKLGEPMRSLADHRNEIILGNDRTGEWARNSAFGDLPRLLVDIQSMDPDWRIVMPAPASEAAVSQGYVLDGPPGQVLFKKLCASCHTIKVGRRVGPDLFGVTERRSRDWLLRFIRSPEAMRRAHDPTALALEREFPGVRMPELGLSDLDAGDLVSYLDLRTRELGEAGTKHAAASHGLDAGISRSAAF